MRRVTTKFSTHLLVYVTCLIFTVDSVTGKNNVCRSFEAYNEMDYNPDCYYSPDADVSSPTQLLKMHVGKVEKYTLVTDDGYILTMHRIPREKAKGVICLVHPVTADGTVWFSSGNDSYAYLFSQAGYDVWIPSYRGTFTSHKHVNLTVEDFEYSNFSFHEVGMYDMKAIIEFIAKKTKRNDIVFIGHSMGSTVGLVYASMLPDEAKQYIKVFILMATPYKWHHFEENESLKLLDENFSVTVATMIHLLEFYKIGMIWKNPFVRILQTILARYPFNILGIYLMALSTGMKTFSEFDPAIMGMYLSKRKYPAGFSAKSFYHYWQNVQNKNFNLYDYGKEENIRLYGSETPPEYPIHKIESPVVVAYSEGDTLTTSKDNEVLYSELPENSKIYGKLKLEPLNHFDYHANKYRIQRVFYPVMNLVNSLFR